MWFCRYIKKITTSGSYAHKYNIVVPRKHTYVLHIDFKGKIDIEKHNKILRDGGYEEETTIDIPIISCYLKKNTSLIKENVDFHFFWQEGERMKPEMSQAGVEFFLPEISVQQKGMGDTKLFINHFPPVYATTKVIHNHPDKFKLICCDDNHYESDLPLDENDINWFKENENIAYDKTKCYLSHYLIACYRIKRDVLDKKHKSGSGYYAEKRQTYKYVYEQKVVDGETVMKRRRVWEDKFKDNPFYGRKLENFKCI